MCLAGGYFLVETLYINHCNIVLRVECLRRTDRLFFWSKVHCKYSRITGQLSKFSAKYDQASRGEIAQHPLGNNNHRNDGAGDELVCILNCPPPPMMCILGWWGSTTAVVIRSNQRRRRRRSVQSTTARWEHINRESELLATIFARSSRWIKAIRNNTHSDPYLIQTVLLSVQQRLRFAQTRYYTLLKDYSSKSNSIISSIPSHYQSFWESTIAAHFTAERFICRTTIKSHFYFYVQGFPLFDDLRQHIAQSALIQRKEKENFSIHRLFTAWKSFQKFTSEHSQSPQFVITALIKSNC